MWRETLAEHLVDVDRFITLREQAQAEFRDLAAAPLRPALHVGQRGFADQGHCAALDDGVALIAALHADVEKAGELPIDHFLESIAFPLAMVLRRLYEGDFVTFEIR